MDSKVCYGRYKESQSFMSGRSQHVTIPAEFRFKTKEVTTRREEQRGDVILSPLQPLGMQIAAHAVGVGATLMTHDRAFRHVAGLLTEDLATDR